MGLIDGVSSLSPETKQTHNKTKQNDADDARGASGQLGLLITGLIGWRRRGGDAWSMAGRGGVMLWEAGGG